MNENFIFEIGTEELPSACIDEGIKSLKVILEEKLIQNRINFGEIKTYGTPRRLTAEVKNLSSMQMQREKTVSGPLKKVAFDKNNSPTKAAVGFAKSLGISVEELEEVKTNRGIYVGKKIVEEGKKTIDILPGILKDTILSLSFNKNMSWSDYSIKFARPIRWLVALYGSKPVKFTIENFTILTCLCFNHAFFTGAAASNERAGNGTRASSQGLQTAIHFKDAPDPGPKG